MWNSISTTRFVWPIWFACVVTIRQTGDAVVTSRGVCRDEEAMT